MIRALVFLSMLWPALALAQTANLWVDTNGGTCTRQSTAAVYNDATACSSIQTALAASSNGDTVRVKAATSYGAQSISAVKSSPGVTVQCESATVGACTFVNFDISGSWIELKDMTFDRGDSCHGCGSYFEGASHITLTNVVLLGAFQANWWGGSDNILWNGGSMWSASRPSGSYYCGNAGEAEPLTITNSDDGTPMSNLTIRNVVFWPMLVNPTNCGADNFHAETIRVDGYVTNLLVDRVVFKDGRQENTGTMFFTNFRATTYGTPVMSGIVVRNSYFGTGNYSFQTGGGAPSTATGSCAVTFEYNTIRSGFALNCSNSSALVFRGNAGMGWVPWLPCTSGNHIKNVWQWSSSFTCGTDTVVIGTDYSTNALGLGGANGYEVQAGSPLINAGETTCATGTGGVDINGNSRPSGSACDAGAHEYGAGGGIAPPAPPTGFRTTWNRYGL